MLEINIWTLLFAMLVIIDIVGGCWRYKKVHGLLHIDEYTNKDVYRMLYFTPLGDLKKTRRLRLKVEVQHWNEKCYDDGMDFDDLKA